MLLAVRVCEEGVPVVGVLAPGEVDSGRVYGRMVFRGPVDSRLVEEGLVVLVRVVDDVLVVG